MARLMVVARFWAPRVLLALCALLATSGQASPLVIPIVLREATEPVPIDHYQGALNAILPVLHGRLALPIPQYTLEIHPARDEFESALVSELKMTPEIAQSTARFAKAAVGNYKILVNESAMAATSWPERTVILAHELGHATQMELCEHRRWVSRQQWLVEGFAEWIAYQVADALDMHDAVKSRETMQREVRDLHRAGLLPPLNELASLEQWVLSQTERGLKAPYSFTFLIMDFLVERHSFEAVVQFFQRFRSSPDEALNFRTVFGEDMRTFQQALEDHFDRLLQ